MNETNEKLERLIKLNAEYLEAYSQYLKFQAEVYVIAAKVNRIILESQDHLNPDTKKNKEVRDFVDVVFKNNHKGIA